jgi:hypothetical protein
MKKNGLNNLSKNILNSHLIDFLSLEDLVKLLNTSKRIRKQIESKSYKIYILKYFIQELINDYLLWHISLEFDEY